MTIPNGHTPWNTLTADSTDSVDSVPIPISMPMPPPPPLPPFGGLGPYSMSPTKDFTECTAV